MKSNRMPAALACRFDRQTRESLERSARETGFSQADLVRHSVKKALSEFQQTKCIVFEG
jgi:predicted urease superfamily metal-dependent hydrolase